MSQNIAVRGLMLRAEGQRDPDKPRALNTWKQVEQNGALIIKAYVDSIKESRKTGVEKPLFQLMYVKFKTADIAESFEEWLLYHGRKFWKYTVLNKIAYDNHTPLHRNYIIFNTNQHADIAKMVDIIAESFGLSEEHRQELLQSPAITQIRNIDGLASKVESADGGGSSTSS